MLKDDPPPVLCTAPELVNCFGWVANEPVLPWIYLGFPDKDTLIIGRLDEFTATAGLACRLPLI
jgi:hypothetical protein